jgi:hypothetical protein
MYTANLNAPDIYDKVDKKLQKKREEDEAKRMIEVKKLIDLAQESNSAQIIIDSFSNIFSQRYGFKTENEALIQTAKQCYKEYNELINKLPKEVAETFIYEYCTNKDQQDIVVNSYNYCKGYKDIFYLLHTLAGVFIVYNEISLQKDERKYVSDFSWGYIDMRGSDIYPDDKRISGNTTQTAEVILSAIFPNDKEKLNLISIFIDTFLIENTTYQTNSSFSKEDVLNWYNNLNLIKRVCLEQKLTYREFGEKVGFGEGAIKNAAASGKISDQLKRAIEMYLEIQKLTKENDKFKKLQELMKEIVHL